uniref:Uncharacterized protein n=1 Tax=Helicotheca tamesis TaxID=374047 RepID=A0A7S2HBD1_9STRA|mmetsp:Transcript_16757/g.22940  ORF Transcript_16757/g.22940 Transcript_16757/m.22940 type:complete len:161 (+) Transcript_16757:135-617(+)
MWQSCRRLCCLPFLVWAFVLNCHDGTTTNASTIGPGFIRTQSKTLCLGGEKKQTTTNQSSNISAKSIELLRGGGLPVPAGWNPFGYAVTELGLKFLRFDGALDCDVGRFLASLKSGRKTQKFLKDQWLEVVRVSKKGQSMRIYRTLDDLIAFCLKAGFID